MIKSTALVICLLGVQLSSSQKVFKLDAVTTEQRKHLFDLADSGQYDFLSLHKIVNQTDTVLVKEELIPKFKAEMARWRIAFKELAQKSDDFKDSHFPNSTEIYERLKSYSDTINSNPDSPIRSTYWSFGKTYKGLDIIAIRIGLKKNEISTIPIILGDAGIHGNEWIAPLAGLTIIENLLFNRTALAILEQFDVIFTPCVNRDGYDASLEKSFSMMYGRKNHQPSKNGDCAVEENVGTNINRNFDWHWDSLTSREDPCNYNYRGDAPNSAPETQALISLMEIKNVKFYYTIHSFGNLILYPYGIADFSIRDYIIVRQIAEAGQFVLQKYFGQHYVIGATSEILYSTTGASKDYASGVIDIPVSLIHEIGGDAIDFQPREECIHLYAESAWVAFGAMALKTADFLYLL